MAAPSNDKKLPWLNEYQDRRRLRTIELTKMGINTLLAKGEKITYSSLSEITKRLDPEGKGLHPNTIKTNADAHNYFSQHKQRRGQYQRKNFSSLEFDFENIKMTRNKQRVINRFMRMTKSELAERLFAAEQYIAENRETWIVEQFKAFENERNK